uniref:Uncharacterized protein n=1 Tax=Strongyloides venezuelensis TaxID=75913 RepID=A0A0K0FRX3_STRVS
MDFPVLREKCGESQEKKHRPCGQVATSETRLLICLFMFSYGGVAVYRCSEAACYMYPSGYMLAGFHHLSRVSYLIKRQVETCVLDQKF